MAPLLAVVINDSVPADWSAAVVVSLLSVDTDKLLKVDPKDARLTAPAPLFTTEALPVVSTNRLGVDVLMLLILPEPLIKMTLPVVFITVPVPLSVPDVAAWTVSAVAA